MTGNGIQHNGAVFYVVRKGTDLVEGRRKGDEAVAGNEAVRRFEADDAAVRRRLADRAARIGAERPYAFAGSDGSGRTARRAAGNIIQSPGVMRNLEGRVFRRAAHGKFIHVGLAQADVIDIHQLFNNRRIVRRFEMFQHLGRARSVLPFNADVIFNSPGNAGQIGNGFTGSDLFIDGSSRFQRKFAVIRQKSLNLRFYGVFAGNIGFRQFNSG